MANPTTRHTAAMPPVMSDRISDLANVAGMNLNQTMLALLEIGLTVVAEQHVGSLAEALETHRNSPSNPLRPVKA